jgi:hypothetical protein
MEGKPNTQTPSSVTNRRKYAFAMILNFTSLPPIDP